MFNAIMSSPTSPAGSGSGSGSGITVQEELVASGSSLSVEHNLGYRPKVFCYDSDGMVLTETSYIVTHTDENNFTVNFGETVTNVTVAYFSDAEYTQETVSAVSSKVIAHNLGSRPDVWFYNSSGVVFTPATYRVVHDSVNQFTVTFGETVTNVTINWRAK